MNFIENYNLDKLSAADYNPRKITEGAFDTLKESLNKFGVCKPVIVNQNGILVAGHQRTKAMKAIGMKETPAFVLEKYAPIHDEIRFNLMHNSIETSVAEITIDKPLEYGYTFVDYTDINVHKKGNGALVKEICRLISKYGDWGSVIINDNGTVICNSDYAQACKALRRPLLVYKMETEMSKEFLQFLKVDYGEYNYENIGARNYNQTHCQMSRNGDSIKSTLYEKIVLPDLKKTERFVDFGAGKMHYVNTLRNKGYNGHAYEPYFKKVGSERFDIASIIAHINEITEDVNNNGLYEKVVLDSVINSVTSNEFEHCVLTVCNALCQKGATFYTGTRNIKATERSQGTQSIDTVRYIEFLDQNNFSAIFRKGVWTLQKFHSVESLRELLLKYFEEVEFPTINSTQICARCRKPRLLSRETYLHALNTEFNLDYPNGYRHNKHEKVVAAIIEALEKERGLK